MSYLDNDEVETEEVFECENDCGFLGSYAEVCDHEDSCNHDSKEEELERCGLALSSDDDASCEAAIVTFGVLAGEEGRAQHIYSLYGESLGRILQTHTDSGVRQAAAETIGKIANDAKTIPALIKALCDASADVRATAVKAAAILSEMGQSVMSTDQGEALLRKITTEIFGDNSPRVRVAAVKACGRIFAARKKHKCGRKAAKKNLADLEGTAAAQVGHLLVDVDADVRVAAVAALGKIGSAAAACTVQHRVWTDLLGSIQTHSQVRSTHTRAKIPQSHNNLLTRFLV